MAFPGMTGGSMAGTNKKRKPAAGAGATTTPRMPAFSPGAMGGGGGAGATQGFGGTAPARAPARGGPGAGARGDSFGWQPPSTGGRDGGYNRGAGPVAQPSGNSWGWPQGGDFSDPATNVQAGTEHPWIKDSSLPWWQTARGQDPTYFGNIPGMLGRGQIESILADPYGYMMTDAPLRGKLGEADTAYNVARQRMGASAAASGAGEGGVSRGMAGNVEGARAADIAGTMRDWEKLKLQMGDQRIAQFLFPWLSASNTNIAATKGTPGGAGGTNWGGVGGGVGEILEGISSFWK